MPFAVFRALGGALACLALLALPCPGGDAAPILWRTVPYGGQFAPERARPVAEAAAWLAGLERAADALAGLDAVRLAGLDALQLQALAAGLGLVEVDVEVRPAGEGIPAGEGDMAAVARLADADAGRVSRLLADEDGRARYEDIVAALANLVPEAARLAETGRSLRVLRALPDAPDGGTPPDEPVIGRLNRLAGQVEAYSLYRAWLDQGTRGPARPEQGDGAAGDSREMAVVDAALALAPDALPLRLARAELLLRQDRFRAAAQVLQDLPAARPSVSPAGGLTARDAAERRLLARALEARALAQLRSGRPALAESDLDAALALTPERASLWLGRGAARQLRERFGPMCDDYHQACVRGLCRGLAAARERGQCQNSE